MKGINDMKIAFVLTMHQSEEIRPNGFDLVDRYLISLQNSCMYDYTVFLFDNSGVDI